jgi:hypothetical protein
VVDSPAVEASSPGPVVRWGSFVLSLLALTQPLVAVALTGHVLAGGLDDPFFVDTTYDDRGASTSVLREVSFWERWELSVYSSPPGALLLAGAAATAALAGLHLVGGGRWRPLRVARVVGVAAGALTVLAAVVDLVLLLALGQRPRDESSGYWGWPSQFVNLAEPVATALVAAVFTAVATVLLLGPALPPRVEEPTAEEILPSEETSEEAPVEPLPEPAETPVAEIPHLREEDRSWYRRPTS